jgi:DNA primase
VQLLIDKLATEEGKQKEHMRAIAEEPILLSMPFGTTHTIDVKAIQWLDKYGIHRAEILANNIQWNPMRHWLVFPIKMMGELKAYTLRQFPQLGQIDVKPKWLTKGPVSSLNYYVGSSIGRQDTVVIVEDIVSAIKVGRLTRAMPLFGSHLSPKKIIWLNSVTKHVIIWLDRDKWKEAMMFAKSCELVGLETKVLYTARDPKDHSDAEIFNLTVA